MMETTFDRFVEDSVAFMLGGAKAVEEPPPGPREQIRLTQLAGDGSQRQIFRVDPDRFASVAVSNPLPDDRDHPDENESFACVGEYLDRRKIPVPRLFATDLDRGYFLMEDLGDDRLGDTVGREIWSDPDQAGILEGHYRAAIDLLVRMQALADPPFRMSMVGNRPYTEEFIIEKEAGYFHEEFVRGFAQAKISFSEIVEDCRRLARGAGPPPTSADTATDRGPVFMHRDFQSRNLMIVGSTLKVIDFQGARLGPPEYDLASLLFDPYATIPAEMRERLLRHYAAAASRCRIPGIPGSLETPDAGPWRRRLLANAANRLMQALGAFAKLGGRLNRPGFVEHIQPGLATLDSVLEERDDCPDLHTLVRGLRRDGVG